MRTRWQVPAAPSRRIRRGVGQRGMGAARPASVRRGLPAHRRFPRRAAGCMAGRWRAATNRLDDTQRGRRHGPSALHPAGTVFFARRSAIRLPSRRRGGGRQAATRRVQSLKCRRREQLVQRGVCGERRRPPIRQASRAQRATCGRPHRFGSGPSLRRRMAPCAWGACAAAPVRATGAAPGASGGGVAVSRALSLGRALRPADLGAARRRRKQDGLRGVAEHALSKGRNHER